VDSGGTGNIPVALSCEHSNYPSSSINDVEFLDYFMRSEVLTAVTMPYGLLSGHQRFRGT
jgi:hypothetical protein